MTRREKTAVRRKQIIEATLRLLADAPLSDVTTRRIARELGLSQPALFRHFSSRAALLLAVIDHARSGLGSVIEDVVGAGPELRSQLSVLTSRLLAFTEANPGFARLLFGDGAGGAGGDSVRAALRQIVSMQRKLVAELVREAQRAGAVRAELSAARAAALFVGMVQGVILQWELGDRATSLVDEAGAVVAFWCRGAGVGEPRAALPVRPESDSPPTDVALVALDARPILAGGEDPLDAILNAVAAAGPGGLIALTTPFRPKPLLSLLASRGHAVEAREATPGVWAVDIVVGGAPALTDLRDLPAPEPLEQVLERTASLAPGEIFVARLPRFPRLLLPHLEARGLRYTLHEQPDGAALLHAVRSKP